MQNKKKKVKEEKEDFCTSGYAAFYFKKTTVWVCHEAMIGSPKNGDTGYLVYQASKFITRYSYKNPLIPNRYSEGEETFRNPSGGCKIFRKMETAHEFIMNYFIEKHGKMYAKPQTGKQKVILAKKKTTTKPTPRKHTK